MPEDPDLSDRIPERREQFNDVRRHEATRHAHQRDRGPSQVRIRQRLAVVPFTNTLGRLRQVDAAAVQVVRAEGRVARREVDLHLLGVAAAAWGWSVRAVVRCVRVRSLRLGEQRCASVQCARWGCAEMAARGEHVLCGYNVRFWALTSSAVAAKANS